MEKLKGTRHPKADFPEIIFKLTISEVTAKTSVYAASNDVHLVIYVMYPILLLYYNTNHHTLLVEVSTYSRRKVSLGITSIVFFF